MSLSRAGRNLPTGHPPQPRAATPLKGGFSGENKMKKAHRYTALLLAVLWSAPGAISLAQTSTAKITGRVTDSSHAVIQGAEITVTNIASGVNRETRSNEEGNYS